MVQLHIDDAMRLSTPAESLEALQKERPKLAAHVEAHSQDKEANTLLANLDAAIAARSERGSDDFRGKIGHGKALLHPPKGGGTSPKAKPPKETPLQVALQVAVRKRRAADADAGVGGDEVDAPGEAWAKDEGGDA